MPLVLTIDPITTRNVTVGQQQGQAIRLAKVELAIRVRKSDIVLGGGLEPGAQGGTIAPVRLVRNDTHRRSMLRRLQRHGARRIATAVVDDQDFVVVGDPCQGLIGFRDGLLDDLLFVVRGQDQRNAGGGSWLCGHGSRGAG